MKTTKSIGIYILRGITLLIAVAIFSFALAQISPVDPVRQYIQANPGVSAENVEAMKEYWGLNDSPVERFFKWFSAVLHGDWGYSTTFRQPVLQVIGIRFKTSLALMMTARTGGSCWCSGRSSNTGAEDTPSDFAGSDAEFSIFCQSGIAYQRKASRGL